MNLEIIHILSGPVIGAAIGYCTNYIAVKMLFRPHHEIRIGKFRLPFTPGLIPKRKDALAVAVGQAVSNSLLTTEDMSEMLLTKDVEDSVADLCMNYLKEYLKSSERMEDVITGFAGKETYAALREKAVLTVSDKIMDGILQAEPATIIAEEGKKAVQNMLAGTMFAMFLHGDTLDSIADELGLYAEKYIREHAPEIITEKVGQEVSALEEKRVYELGEPLLRHEERIEEKIREIYRSCIGKIADSIVKQFHIDRIIEDKIKAMDVMELENLVMSVMKHELGMIVNLGALIGLVLGIINIFL